MRNCFAISLLLGLPAMIAIAVSPLGCASRESAKNVAEDRPAVPLNPVVVIETSMGKIVAELWADKAPKSVANFLQYVDGKFYDGLIIHRIVPGFVIQGGGFTADLQFKQPKDFIQNEARSDVRNARGTLSMARMAQIHSANSQFFINLVNNGMWDHIDETPAGYGYCVFGKVIQGMDIVDTIAKVATSTPAPGMEGVPVTPVVIKSVLRQAK